jgi:hypothetical protein
VRIGEKQRGEHILWEGQEDSKNDSQLLSWQLRAASGGREG